MAGRCWDWSTGEMQTWDDLRAIPTQAVPNVSQRRLTDHDAATIRQRFEAERQTTIIGLAREYDVSDKTIARILTNRTYRDDYAIYQRFGRFPGTIEPMPCSLDSVCIAAMQNIPTATEESNNRHMAAWWAADARIQAANDAWDALNIAAD